MPTSLFSTRIRRSSSACPTISKSSATILFATNAAIAEQIAAADLVVGAVLVPGAAAPKLVSKAQLSSMQPGAVLVDVAIDQGGCFETSRATTHSEPTYVTNDIVHYCVANMPGAVARTSTYALNNVTLPFAIRIADQGWRQALTVDLHLREGLNVCRGHVTCAPVARDLGYDYLPAGEAIAV